MGLDLGALLIGSQVYCFFLGVILVQTLTYFRRYCNDSVPLKATVAFLATLEISYIVVYCAAIYHHVIGLFNSPIRAGIPSVLFALTSTPNAISMLIVNVFLIWRYFRLTKNWIICIPLLLVALASFGTQLWAIGVFVLAIKGIAATGFHEAPTASLALEAAIVTLVAALLVHHLRKFVKTEISDTKKLLNRIIVVTIETGAATTIMAIVTLIVFKADADSAIAIVLGGITGRIASLSMLFNLNMRGSGGHLMGSMPSQQHSSTPQTFSLRTVNASRSQQGKDDRPVSAAHQTLKVEIEQNVEQEDTKDSSVFTPAYNI